MPEGDSVFVLARRLDRTLRGQAARPEDAVTAGEPATLADGLSSLTSDPALGRRLGAVLVTLTKFPVLKSVTGISLPEDKLTGAIAGTR